MKHNKIIISILTIFIILLSVGCSNKQENIPDSNENVNADYDSLFQELEEKYDATLGIYALDTETNKEISYNADERFAYCSTYKALAAGAILEKYSIEELDNSVKYELLTRLNSMKNHTKLCHGDYCPDNIIVTADAKGNIKEITAVDWVHATQGNASADIANTFLLLKLQFGDKSDIPEKYISAFCELTNTKRSYVNEWLPLVAAARLTKNKEEEKELLNQWINVVDFQ